MSRSCNFFNIVTYTVRFTFWLMILQMIGGKARNPLSDSPLEVVGEEIPAQEEFRGLSDFYSSFYKVHLISPEEKELNYLRNEIKRLENEKAYEKLYLLILAYKNREIEALSHLVQKTAETIIVEYKRRFDEPCVNEQEKFYLLINVVRVYIIKDDFYAVLNTLNQAIDLALEFSDIHSSSSVGKSIARFQKLAIEELLSRGHTVTSKQSERGFLKIIPPAATIFNDQCYQSYSFKF